MMDIYDRIHELMTARNISAATICKNTGISSALMTQWKQRKQNPSGIKLQKIADYFHVSVDYLLGNEDEKDIDEEPNAEILPSNKIRMIPLFDSVSAGFGAYADGAIIDYVPCYIESDYEADETICITVIGDSMSPKIEDKDIIQVRKQSSVDSGDIAVVLIDGDEALVKKVYYGNNWVELHSINPAYPIRRFVNNDVYRVNIVGKVRKIIRNI